MDLPLTSRSKTRYVEVNRIFSYALSSSAGLLMHINAF